LRKPTRKNRVNKIFFNYRKKREKKEEKQQLFKKESKRTDKNRNLKAPTNVVKTHLK
jgi:hypothetical protein